MKKLAALFLALMLTMSSATMAASAEGSSSTDPAPAIEQEQTSEPSANLVAHYEFDEADQSETVADATANANNGAIDAKGTFEDGKFGNALRFVGNTVVAVPDSDSLDLAQGTFAMWLKPDAFNTFTAEMAELIHKGTRDYASEDENYNLAFQPKTAWGYEAGTLQSCFMGMENGKRNHVVLSDNTESTLIHENVWNHFALTYDTQSMKIYLGGELVFTKELTGVGAMKTNAEKMVIGKNYKGLMDDLRIYDSALSADEIVDIYGREADVMEHTVTITSGENGSVSPSGQVKVPDGGSQKVTFTPAAGYELDTVTVDGAPVKVNGLEYTLGNVTADMEIIVTFKGTPASASVNVLHFDFEDISSGVKDQTFHKNDGTLVSGAQTEGKFGKALQFTADTRVNVADAASLDMGTNTISVWLKPDTYGVGGGATPMLISKGSNTTENYSAGVYLDGAWGTPGSLLFSYLSDQGRQLINGAPGLVAPAGEWSHIVITYDETAMRAYLNGELIKEIPGKGRLVANDKPLMLGNGYKGAMDDLRIYNNALTPEEVEKLYKNEELPPIETVNINLSTAGDAKGFITPKGLNTIIKGGDFTFTVKEFPGYHLEKVTVDDQQVELTDWSYTITNAQANMEVVATFVEDTYTQSSGDTTYYLDSETGNDSNNGTSPETAWKTVQKASSVCFAPGDRILLKSGSVFTGQLWPKGSGAEGNPIEISWYGFENENSPKPIINGNKQVRVVQRHGAVQLVNQEYWEIRNLEITNDDDFDVDCYTGTADDNADGVSVVIDADLLPDDDDDRVMNHIYIENCYIHDVDSPTARWLSIFSGGVTFNSYGSKLYKSTYFQDVRIAYNRIVKCDLLAIPACFNNLPMDGWQHMLEAWDGYSKDVYIGHNYTENIGQGSIDITNSKNVLCEYNVVNGHAMRYSAVCVALYPWKTENCVMQNNEVYGGGVGNQDGTAFDFDAGLHNCVYQYNYTHDNPCGWMLYMGTNSNDIARYNLSVESGDWLIKYFDFANSTPAYFLNNVFIYDSAKTGFHSGTFFGQPVNFHNNIFYNTNTEKTSRWFHQKRENGQPVTDDQGNPVYDYGTSHFSNNCFYEASGKHAPDEPIDANKVTLDPKFVGPFTEGQEIGNSKLVGFEHANRFKLNEDSSLIDKGVYIPQMDTRDFFDNKLYYGQAPDIGMHEVQKGTHNDLSAIEYNITVDSNVTGGVITVPAKAHIGDLVKVELTPENGYEMIDGSLKVNGGAVKIKDSLFLMPNEDVTITAKFDVNNLALGKTYSASDSHPSLTVDAAFNGRLDDRWAAGNSDVPKWLEVDFGAMTEFNTVFVKEWKVSGYNGSRVDDWEIQYWDADTQAWKNALTGSGIRSQSGEDDGSMEMEVAFDAVRTTKMRFNITSLKTDEYGGLEPSINEIKVYNKESGQETYTVTFDVDGVQTTVSAQKGEPIVMPANPVKEGYTFAGWYTAPTGGNEVTEFTATQTVYAQWTKNQPQTVNKSALRKSYEYALTLSTEGVVETAAKRFDAAVTNADKVLNDANATQKQVDAAWDELAESIWGLGLLQGDKTTLKLFIDKAESMLPNKDIYVTANWQQLVDTLKAAKAVLDNGDAMEEDVVPAAENLMMAILAQRYKADKSILEDLIGQSKKVNLARYTEKSANALRQALKQAEAVFADEALSEDDQSVVDNAVDSLQSALQSLELKPEEGNGSDNSSETDGSQPGGSELPPTGESGVGEMLLLSILAGSLVLLAAKRKRAK